MSEENEDEKRKKLGIPPTIPPPSIPPPTIPPPSTLPPTIPPPPAMPPQPSPEIPSGPSQQEYEALLSQVEEKNNTINQLKDQLSSLQLSAENYQKQIKELNEQTSNLNNILIERDKQIDQLSNEKIQLESQVQEAQQQVLTLQQQVTPLQQQVAKLQEEVAYKEKRIEELKEPRAVMASTLGQQSIDSQPPASSSVSTTPAPIPEIKSGRRVCPNCSASGFAIKEVEDKSKIISYIPKPIYAKKMVCTKCGYEF